MDCDLKSSLPIPERAPAQASALLARKRVAVPADPSAAQGKTKASGVSLLRNAWGTWQTHALALADQGVVSGGRFLTTVAIGRWTLPSELGSYSIAMSLLLLLFCVQESLISLPYTIQRHRSLGRSAQDAGSSLAHSGQLSVLAVAVLAVGATGLSAANAAPELIAATWVLTGVAPFVLLREFGRRFAFAHLHLAEVLMLDLAVAVMQLAGIWWLGSIGWLSSATACAALGLASATVSIVWLQLASSNFSIRGYCVRQSMKQSWALGKWLCADQLTNFLRGYMAHWILAGVAGIAASGVYAASMSVAALANPVMLGFSNILAPKAAMALSEGGGARLLRETIREALLLGALMGLFCAVVVLTGEDAMRFLYHGKAYEGQGDTVVVLTLAFTATAVGMPPSNALASLERPRAIFWITLFAAPLTAVLVWYLANKWGPVGAACGFLAGNVAASAGRWIAFLTLVPSGQPKADPAKMPSNATSANVIGVLQHLTQGAKDRGWVIETLGEGFQAHVFAVRSQDQQPIWQTHRALVIKLYKPGAEQTTQLVRDQFESLSRLHAAVNGKVIDGWKIFVPAPLYLCKSPLALVMTMASGRNLDWCLQDGDNVTPEVLESAPRAIAAALKEYWLFGHPYGELKIGNMLCDIMAREISFVDPGMRHNSLFCHGVTDLWYPASRDAAFLLYDEGLELSIGNHSACIRRELFTDGILRAVIEAVAPTKEKQQLLNEIDACVQEHLKLLGPRWSPHGLWHALVRPIASRRIERLLARLRTDARMSTDGFAHRGF